MMTVIDDPLWKFADPFYSGLSGEFRDLSTVGNYVACSTRVIRKDRFGSICGNYTAMDMASLKREALLGTGNKGLNSR